MLGQRFQEEIGWISSIMSRIEILERDAVYFREESDNVTKHKALRISAYEPISCRNVPKCLGLRISLQYGPGAAAGLAGEALEKGAG